MLAKGLHSFLDAYRGAIAGLRTGQTGKANACLAIVTEYLSKNFTSGQGQGQVPQRATDVISAMLYAKQRNDMTGVADILQFEIPAVMPELEVSPGILDVELLEHLCALNIRLGKNDEIPLLVAGLQDIYRLYPAQKGLSIYHGSQLYLANRYTEANAVLKIDESISHRTPSVAHLLAILNAYQGNFSKATVLMEWAYEKTASLQDGFVDLGWTLREAVSAQESLEIGIQDEKLGRISPNGKISLAVLYQRVGDSTHAQELIAAAYVADPNIKDGFSRLGWQGYLQGAGTTFFETFVRKDAELGRRSSAGRIYAALCSAAIGAVSHAEASVENGYFGNPDMRNWNCSIGWLCIRRGDLAKGYELMMRDYNAGRMDEEWLPTFAVALSLNGQCDEAESIAGKLVGCRLDLGRLIVGHRAAPDRVFEYPELQQFVAKQRSFCDLDERRAIVQAN